MAQQVRITLTDDIDGTTADETVFFGLDGAGYEIDLTAAHARELRETLALYVARARKTFRPARVRRSSGSGQRTGEQTRVRKWARSQGIEVSERGRLSKQVMEAYANRLRVVALDEVHIIGEQSSEAKEAMRELAGASRSPFDLNQ